MKLSPSGESTVFENTHEITVFSDLQVTHDDSGRSCQLLYLFFSSTFKYARQTSLA